jgi:hypothetical protein
VTDGRYKLIIKGLPSCTEGKVYPYEFYDLFAAPFAEALGGRGIDHPIANLLPGDGTCDGSDLPPEAAAAFAALDDYAQNLLASGTPVPGDGNLDRIVDAAEVAGIVQWWGGPSVYDFDHDGMTDGADLAAVLMGWTPRP